MGELPTYVCRRTHETITIDGHLTESTWARAEALGDFRFIDGIGEPQLPTELRMCWDEENLYLGFVCVDKNKTTTSGSESTTHTKENEIRVLFIKYKKAAETGTGTRETVE